MSDVLLVSMPFGPMLSPSLGLSLLKPEVMARGLTCQIEYFTLPFAEKIGHQLYSKITGESRVFSRAFVGEWIFSHALFDWSDEHDERYVTELLLHPPSWLAGKTTRPPGRQDLKAIRAANRMATDFVTWCADRIVSVRPRVVGFTSVFQQQLASLALAKQVKARLPETVIVFGGANCEATMGVETVRQFAFVDAVVSGEGDLVFADLSVRVADGKPFDDLPGVITARTIAAAPHGAPTAPAVTDMDALPYPDYDDFFSAYHRSPLARTWEPSVFVETSRGCWWGERMHCTFCGLNGATMAYRSKSAPRALAELTHLAGAHPGCAVQVVDNILDLKYFKTLLPALAERKLNVSLFYETKSNLKKDQVRLLRDAGVTEIQPGIESFSDNVLKQMKKGVSGLQNIQLLKWCKEIGVDPQWNFLVGFPQESPDDYAVMADMIPQVCHLPRPFGVTAIRIDRFSPNFNESGRLGFTKLRPLPFYEFIYDLPDEVRRNLAYYFAYDYKSPQDLASYSEALVRRVHSWKTTWQHAELLSMDVDGRLILLDTRPVAAGPMTVLTGLDRDLYLACDAITESAQFPASSLPRLDAMVDRGLVMKHGARYLSLAVALGDYQPSAASAERLRDALATVGAADRRGVRVALSRPAFQLGGAPEDTPRSPSRRPVAAKARSRRAKTGPQTWTRDHFELLAPDELFVRWDSRVAG